MKIDSLNLAVPHSEPAVSNFTWRAFSCAYAATILIALLGSLGPNAEPALLALGLVLLGQVLAALRFGAFHCGDQACRCRNQPLRFWSSTLLYGSGAVALLLLGSGWSLPVSA